MRLPCTSISVLTAGRKHAKPPEEEPIVIVYDESEDGLPEVKKSPPPKSKGGDLKASGPSLSPRK